MSVRKERAATPGRPFAAGNPGRPKGTPNKLTTSIKAAFLEAFEQRGGVPALLAWADTEPTEFYKLAARLIPTEVAGDLNGALTITVTRDAS
jgi:hypothetical protein